jgi:hypothetical protein
LLFSNKPTEEHCAAARRLIAMEGGEAEYVKNMREALDGQIQLNPQLKRFENVFIKWQDEYLNWAKMEGGVPKVVEIQ